MVIISIKAKKGLNKAPIKIIQIADLKNNKVAFLVNRDGRLVLNRDYKNKLINKNRRPYRLTKKI